MPEYNIAVVGSGGVGKSALTILFCHGNFVEEYDPTIEDSYRKQVGIDGHALILNILDTAGQEEYAGMRDQWMGRQEGFIMVYSIIDQNTFLQTQDWNQMITRLFEKDEYPRVLFGNKVDLASERAVTTDEGENISRQWKIPFYEGSAKAELHVADAFETIVREIWRVFPQKNPKQVVTDPKTGETKTTEKKRWCILL